MGHSVPFANGEVAPFFDLTRTRFITGLMLHNKVSQASLRTE